MVEKTAITEVFRSVADAENRFGLRRSEAEDFFPEWCENLPPLTDAERASLDLIRRRFIYHRQDGDLTEGTVTLLMGSPLLEMTGFYDYPFKMRGEASIELVLNQDEEEIEPLRGRIDILTMQNRFWVVILESKRTTISATTALPQTLAYMMANPHPQQPIFGMVTNGDDIFFVKLVQTGNPQYAISRTFAPFASSRELHNAAQVLKNMSRIIG